MKTANAFKFVVYKDQGVAANRGKVIEVGDTVTLVVRNSGSAPSTVDVVVTAIGNGGKDIQWDSSTTHNVRSEDVIRVHAKHQYQCPGPLTYQAVLTESSPTTALMAVTGIVLNGVTYSVNVTEEGAPGTGITAKFVSDLADKLNSITGVEGFWSVTASATAVTIVAKNLTYVWSSITASGATVTQPTVVP